MGPPDAAELLKGVSSGKPLAIILAGHNGSGKSTLWKEKFTDVLQIPLINADRLVLSILPEPKGDPPRLPSWADYLRDNDERWQRVSQLVVQSFIERALERRVSFAYETVFSYFERQPDGSYRSKGDLITGFQQAGYAVALLFVGLANAEISKFRVETRREQGGHAVPENKLYKRFPRTQEAIAMAAPRADLTLMFDNSRTPAKAFSLVRAQAGSVVHYDCRASGLDDKELVRVADIWLSKVAPKID